MSGDDRNIPEENPPEEAVFKPSRWPGLIWAVPLAAVAIIAWLGISALTHSGPSVEVWFPVTGGLKPGTTKVQYQGFNVGHVGDVTISKSLNQMKVQIDFDSSMAGHLGPGTRYWIEGANFSLSNLSDIKEVISGPVIGVDPRPGKTVGKAQGLGEAPVLKSAEPGLQLALVTPELSHISSGSPVFYKGYKVGQVLDVAMAPDGKQFTIRIFVKAQWQNLVKADSRFWYAGAVRVSTAGGPGVQLESVPALLLGAVAFETPKGNAASAENEANYTLYDSKAQAENAPGSGAVLYQALFAGGPHGLAVGAPVQLEGSPVGSVTAVTMRYDATAKRLETLVTLALQPQRINLANGTWNLADPAPQMNAMLATLIAQGLRAELGSSVPVVGGKTIQLDLVKDAPPAALQPGNPPELPVFGSGGGDVGQVIAQVNDILASINAMPLDKIAVNIHSATSRLAALAKSRQTKQTLLHLDRAMAHVDDITRQAKAQLPAILASLRQTAAQAQAALASARGMLSPQGPANASTDEAGLPHTLYELSQAAASLRALADYLNSHPGALIAGRGD
ncbi:intermembrane transport protein PqiB [Acidocella sp. MX-AZ02]|uniref:PqiB family protein n=1 Tax=Acidocella sp. MX-AZ02 TaxID=1214225 RepID=UPI00028D1043|nr:MlaD family protein [Acidocella sp. MX-AZ02]EKM98213.1 hypothetical protein MXAZACID_16594 [Acidocella sp. MX-AZ02]